MIMATASRGVNAHTGRLQGVIHESPLAPLKSFRWLCRHRGSSLSRSVALSLALSCYPPACAHSLLQCFCAPCSASHRPPSSLLLKVQPPRLPSSQPCLLLAACRLLLVLTLSCSASAPLAAPPTDRPAPFFSRCSPHDSPAANPA
jgi:hypothetical protein